MKLEKKNPGNGCKYPKDSCLSSKFKKWATGTWEGMKSAMDPYCRQYKTTLCFYFSLTAQLPDDQTHLGAAKTQMFCLIIHALGM
jgi:hypothetical protein